MFKDVMSNLFHSINGHGTISKVVKNKLVRVYAGWSSTENNANNAWNVNFSNGSVNNNNKYNSNVVRPVCALEEEEIQGWIDAYFNCIKNKRTKPQCNLYRMNYEEDLLRLAIEVNNGTYKPTTSTCFIVTYSKYREVFAAAFRDRIVQHWLMMRVEPYLEQRFRSQGDVSYNCRKGYGTLRANLRLRDEIERVSEDYTCNAWVGKYDIRSFFMSIDKSILMDKLEKFLREVYRENDLEKVLWLLRIVVMHCPQDDCVRRSSPELWERLPKHKSLFNSDRNIGVAIGNITSQLLANFYLSFFDEWVIEQCKKCGAGYVRFVDDWVLVAKDKQFILDLRRRADKWLRDNLRLTMHKDKDYIQHVIKGVKFVGQVIKPHRNYLNNGTVNRFLRRMKESEKTCKSIIEDGYTIKRSMKLDAHACSINSYMGFLCHANSYAIRRKAFEGTKWFRKCCYLEGHFLKVKVKQRYKFNNLLKYLEYGNQLVLRRRAAGARVRDAYRRASRIYHSGDGSKRRRKRRIQMVGSSTRT